MCSSGHGRSIPASVPRMISNTRSIRSGLRRKTNGCTGIHGIAWSIRASARTRPSLSHLRTLEGTLDLASLKRRIISRAFAWRIIHYPPPFSIVVFPLSSPKAALGECDDGRSVGALLGGFGLIWEGIGSRHHVNWLVVLCAEMRAGG